MDSYSLIKSSNGITSVSLDARLLANRIIYIDDQQITGELVGNVVKNNGSRDGGCGKNHYDFIRFTRWRCESRNGSI